MGSEGRQLHIFLFPFMAHGHMIPMVDMAKLFASRGVKITIVTTPLNSISISKSLHAFNSQIDLLILRFPSAEAGLPDACENADAIPSLDLLPNFFAAVSMLQAPFEQALLQNRPDGLVADMFFPWTNDVADKIGIPRLIFHGTSSFSLCASEFMRLHEPYKHVSSDTEPFLIPHLPGDIRITKMQLPATVRESVENEFTKFITKVKESESVCYGVVVNSFYELEAEYADCYRDVLGRKAWHIGPLSLSNNKGTQEITQRGRESAIDENECLKWLDSQQPNSVVYVCFGSLAKFNTNQLKEIASGLECSGKKFIWVVRRGKEEEEDQDWLPEGFEERMEGKGLIIRGWAPQVLILDHPAVGGFVTHCGWNSTLEGVAAGVPMVTWPVGAEQFYNEKLVTEVLKSGVAVGVKKWVAGVGDFIGREAVEKAIRRIMEGEEVEEMRNRARELAEKAKRAVERDFSYFELISWYLMVQKRPFHVQHGDGFGTPCQEPKRINMSRIAFGEDSLLAVLEPLIRKVVREETECAISKLFPSTSSSSVNEAETTTAGCSLQLLFDGKLPDRIFTNNPLKAEGGKPLKIQLCYANSKTIVESGPLSSAKVNFVVISGLFSSDREDWTEEEFNSKILSEREGRKPLLAGPQSIVLKNGVGVISDLSITDNSSWIPNKKFILGAKISPKVSGEQRVKPARSYPFSVKDSRGEGYTKHHPPSLQDEVWRLEKIRKDGKFHQQLALHKIVTVQDFLLLNETNQPKLRHILVRMSDKIWRKVLDHAKTCIMDNCTVPRYPNGWDGALVKDLNQPIYLNRLDEQPTPKLPLTYQQAGPSMPPNLGFQLLEPSSICPQENLQIRAPNTDNNDEDGATLFYQPTPQADYIVENYTFLPQTPVYYPPATLGLGSELLPSPSYAAEAGGCAIFPYLDHGADILNGAD